MTDGPQFPPPPPADPPGAQPPPDAGPASVPWWKSKRAKLPTWLWIVIGVLAALTVIGALTSPDEDEADAETATTDEVTESAAPVDTEPVETVPVTDPPVETEPETTQAPTTTTAPTTTAVPTTTIPERDGSREYPWDFRATAEGGADTLSSEGAFSTFLLLNVRPFDFAAIEAANQFNDPPLPGQHYAAMTHIVGVDPAVSEPMSGSSVQCDLVGDKAKIYEPAFVVDDGTLNMLDQQPDALGGGTLAGDVFYLVDDDDVNLIGYCSGVFAIPGP